MEACHSPIVPRSVCYLQESVGDTLSQVVIRGLRALTSTRWHAQAMEKQEIADYSRAVFGPLVTPDAMQYLTATYEDLISSCPLQYQYFRYSRTAQWSTVTKFLRDIRAPSSSQSQSPALRFNYEETFGFGDVGYDVWRDFILTGIEYRADDPFDDFHSPHPLPPRCLQ